MSNFSKLKFKEIFDFQFFLVFDPKSVRDQMVFESFTMLKMFFTAVATGNN